MLHLPLYRQEDAFARLGVRLSRETLCDWVMKAAFSLRPVANEIARQIRAGPVLQLDDTPIKVMRPGPGGERIELRQSQLWVFVKPEVPGVAFRFSEGRSAKVLACLLRSEDADAVDVIEGDGLETNRAGAREAGMEVRHAGCGMLGAACWVLGALAAQVSGCCA